jgi:putative DNA primase/helicase
MTAPGIARALGAARRSGHWWRCVCPVHGSRTGRSASLALRDGERGLIVVCHAGCPRAEIIAELRRRELIAGRGNGPPAVATRCDEAAGDERRVALARVIWEPAQNARRTPVTAYLASRGLTISPPVSLRYAPALRRLGGTSSPAMVARIDNIDGELIGISRTWLDHSPDGRWRRRDRAMLGCAAGGAVRLAPADETLMIGEGVETCLAAIQATGQPAWAALSTSGMMALRLPVMVRTVVILADHDRNGAGERAAHTAAQRWLAEGRRVRIALPPEPDTDFADVLAGAASAPTAELRDVAA